MADFQTFVLTLISSAGISVALSATGVWLARSWITERLQQSIKYEYDEKLAAINAELKLRGDSQLAALKAEVDRQAEKLRIASTSFSEVQKTAIARKFDAVDDLWRSVLSMRKTVPGVMGLIDVLQPSEYASAMNNTNFRGLMSRFDITAVINAFTGAVGDLEKNRPYVGEYVWALFSTFGAVTMRMVFLVDLGRNDPSKLTWYKDQMLVRLVNSALGAEAGAAFENLPFGHSGWIRNNFERKILEAIEKLITGKEFGEAALRQAHSMEDLIRSLNSPVRT